MDLILGFFISLHSSAQKGLIVITYPAASQSMTMLAKVVARGAEKNKCCQIKMAPFSNITDNDIKNTNAIIIGSPVYNANPSPEVLNFINTWPFSHNAMEDKIGAVFVSAGSDASGATLVEMIIIHAFMMFSMLPVGSGNGHSPFGAYAVAE